MPGRRRQRIRPTLAVEIPTAIAILTAIAVSTVFGAMCSYVKGLTEDSEVVCFIRVFLSTAVSICLGYRCGYGYGRGLLLFPSVVVYVSPPFSMLQ